MICAAHVMRKLLCVNGDDDSGGGDNDDGGGGGIDQYLLFWTHCRHFHTHTHGGKILFEK